MEVCAEGAAGPNGLAGAVEVKGSAFSLPWWSEKSHQVSSGCWGPVPALWPVVAVGLSPITSALRVGAQQGLGAIPALNSSQQNQPCWDLGLPWGFRVV